MQAHCFLFCIAWTWRTDCSLLLCNSPFFTWHIIWCDFMGLHVHQGLIVKIILIWSHWVKNKRRTNVRLFANKDREDKTEDLPYVFTSWNSFNILLVLLLNVLWGLLLRSYSQAMSLARSSQSMDSILQRSPAVLLEGNVTNVFPIPRAETSNAVFCFLTWKYSPVMDWESPSERTGFLQQFLEVLPSKCQASSSIVENPKLSGRGLIKGSQTGCGE